MATTTRTEVRVKVSFLDGTVRTIVAAVEDRHGKVWFVDVLGCRISADLVIRYEVLELEVAA